MPSIGNMSENEDNVASYRGDEEPNDLCHKVGSQSQILNSENEHFESAFSIHSRSVYEGSFDGDNNDGEEEEDKVEYLKPEPDFEDINKVRKIAFVILMASTQLITQSMLAESIIPSNYIAKTFGVGNNGGQVSWMTSAFSLTLGTFILIAGRFGDLLGYKRMYLLSFLNLSIWSILAGVSRYSKNIIFFDFCRGMQGLSLAVALPNSLALLGAYFPPGKQRILAFSTFGAVAPAGFGIGALWSALFTEESTWEWIYYTTGIVVLGIYILGYFIIPNKIGTKIPNLSWEMFDPIGSVLGMSGLILINFSFNQGPTVGWDVVYVYVLLIVGILLTVAFFYSQRKVKYPLIPKLNFTITMTLICMIGGWSSFGVWLFYQAKFSMVILNQSSIVIALQFLPAIFSGIIAAMTVGYLINHNIVPICVILLFAMCFFEIGIILNGLRPVSQIYWIQKFLSLILTPFAMDSSFPAGTILLSMSLPKKHQGVAGSLISTVVNYSVAIGLGLAGTAEYYTVGRDGMSELDGIRRAFYTGMGLAGMGIVVASLYCLNVYFRWRRQKSDNEKV